MKHLIPFLILCLLSSCVVEYGRSDTSCAYARHFDVVQVDSVPAVVIISPHDGRRDTLIVAEPMDNIICMSTSHVACLSVIGADSVITAVSGLGYVSDPDLRSRDVHDIGYEASLDYERILSLDPDLLVAYTVSSAEPPFLEKLRALGVPVVVLHDHLENHPLARAEYMRLFGVLTGRRETADSVFRAVAQRYEALSEMMKGSHLPRRKVLVNIPYGDAWYVPGEESYMARLVKDAGGDVLGAEEGTSVSGTVSIEEAWALSREADIWLNPGHCSARAELMSFHSLFPLFGPMEKGLPVYNNTLRMTPEGGNDFYESGAVRPDLILEDLILIFSEKSVIGFQNDGLPVITEDAGTRLNYFKPLN